MVAPGTYTVKLIKGDKTFSGKLELITDPLSPHTEADRELQRKTVAQLFQMCEDLAFVVKQINIVKDSVKTRADKTKDAALKKSLTAYMDKLEALRKTLVATRESAGITGEERLREKLSMLYASVASYEGKPTDSQLDRLRGMELELSEAQKKTSALLTKDLDVINAQTAKTGMGKISLISREQFDKETGTK
jgi:hypothetical protein